MLSKNNLKYIVILAIGFLWCSSLYLSQEQYLLRFLTPTETNIVDMLFGSLAMALGIITFINLYKKNYNIKNIYLIFLAITIGLSIIFFSISSSIILSIILCLICLLGAAGFGAGYHFSLVSSKVNKEYRGRVFAIGYAIGTIGTYLLSLLPSYIFKSGLSLLFYIPLILLNIYLIYKEDNLTIISDEKSPSGFKNYFLVIIVLVLLMALVTSFSSNICSLKNINLNTGFAYPRLYYAIGLIIAGFLADKKEEYLEIATIVSLFFPLLAILFLQENISPLLISSLNYMFIAFFVVFRTTIFMNLKDINKNNVVYAGLGLCFSRIVEGLLVLINIYYQFNYLFLIIMNIVLLSIILIIYLLFFYKKFEKSEEDIIKELRVKYKLSSQETKVLELIIKDYTNQEMADKLFLSINTIRNHVANIYKKTKMKKKELKEICILKTI